MKIFSVGAWLFAINIVVMVPAWGRQHQQPLEIRTLFKPGTVRIGKYPMAYYELLLANRSNDSIRLQKLDVFNSKGTLIRSVQQPELAKRDSRAGAIYPPGTTGVIYLEMVLPADNPGALKHRLAFETVHNQVAGTQSVQYAVTNFSKQPPIVVGAPVRGGAWAAVYEPSWQRGHRRVIYVTGGDSSIPGRFAIDFIKLDPQGRYAAGDENEIKNWYGYGMEVLAVADGTIASTLDDFPESPTLSGHPAYPPAKATGNYISINIGKGRLAFYEHLKPGSIKVKAGQRVKKGDTIASIGFTGQTTGPHLHFHIADTNSPLGAEGLPFAFERFTTIGVYPDFDKFGKAGWTALKDRMASKERPAPNTVIRFKP